MYEKGQQTLMWGKEEKENEKHKDDRLKDRSKALYWTLKKISHPPAPFILLKENKRICKNINIPVIAIIIMIAVSKSHSQLFENKNPQKQNIT